MKGLTDEEIKAERERIKEKVALAIREPVELIDSFISENPDKECKNDGIWYLGKSLTLLSQADIAYFGRDWKNARGCLIEHEVAKQYKIKNIMEEK